MSDKKEYSKPYFETEGGKILHGHTPDVLRSMPSGSVQMCVTSPPYWGLRDYDLPPMVWDAREGCAHEWGEWQENHDVRSEKVTAGKSRTTDRHYGNDKTRRFNENHQKHTAGQFCQTCNAWRGCLGLEPTPELYIKHMVEIFRELKRVLRNDGTFWLNMGDSYSAGTRDYNSFRRDRAHVCVPKAPLIDMPPKNLLGIPWRLALALQADGWYLRSAMPWVKRSAMPESVADRPASALEYMFLLTKSGTSQYWTHRDTSGTRTHPKADWRWISRVTNKEKSEVPADWKKVIRCPNCEGTGRAMVDVGYEFMGKWIESYEEDECPICEGKKRIQKWKRINLWQGHDYYFDMDAIRVGYLPESISRRKYNATNTGDRIQKHQPGRPPRDNGSKKYPPNPGGRNFRNTDLFFESLIEPHGMIFCGDEMVGIDCNPQAMKEAHFAAFPEKLIEPCILAGTSERGVCVECGSPWSRVVEKLVPELRNAESKYPGEHSIATRKYKHDESAVVSKTIGWKPSCECGEIKQDKYTDGSYARSETFYPAKTEPCIVLDLFGGAMTTAIVSHKHGRRWTMIELSKEYIDEIGIPRIKKETKQRGWSRFK